MPASTESRSGMSYGWNLGENNWNTGMDNNILFLGRFGVHLSIIDRDLTAPPGGETAGDTYIVGAAPTGAWATHAAEVAIYDGVGWVFSVPRVGWIAYIEDEQVLSAYKLAGWSAGVAI